MKMMIIFFISLLLIVGFVAFASKPSPVYGGLSLVASGGLGCAVVVCLEDVFLGLVVFLVYLGGMLVVFGYTAAMATEEFPETWVGNAVAMSMLLFVLLMEVVWYYFSGEVHINMAIELFDFAGSHCIGQDFNGVSLLYWCGGWALALLGWILFITIYVVLEVVRGR
ncbi:NADH dehydrogenase subunit 6 (mitochondrion) [Gracilinanus agilis]|uniref:NADH-ubiquinone oxidoreductase chain 6 n=1 Tax=Gracilinanus agilis TaxID=191870 RepID=A0A7S8WU52_GRAAG|nr:NADH dehydrogenase subunit 6 [Gracilinanus agilis]QPF23137.1 NADH dehydrogenase subunit 6 [Gracilinanus agilis]